MILDNIAAHELRARDRVSILGDPVAGVIRTIQDGGKTHILYRVFSTGLWTVDTLTSDDWFEVIR